MVDYIELAPRLKEAGDIYIELLKAGWKPENAELFLNRIPDTSYVAPVVRGRWKFNKDGSGTCDQCRHTQASVWDMDSWQNFCGHCGADMRRAEHG